MSKKRKKQKAQEQTFTAEDIPQHTMKTIKRLFQHLAKQKMRMAIVVISGLCSCFAFALTPLYIGSAIDNLVEGVTGLQDTDAILPMLYDALATPVIALIILSIICAALSYLQQYVVASVGENLNISLRQAISAKLTKLPLRYFDGHKTGDILSRVTNDLEKVSEVMQVGLMQFISSVFTIVTTIIIMLLLDVRLSVIVLISVIAGAIATVFVSNKCQAYFAKNQQVMGELNARIEEVYSGNMILKVFNQQEQTIASVLALNEQQYQAMKQAQFVNYAIYPTIRILNQLGFIATAFVGGIMVVNGQISLGGIQAFLQYVNQIGEPITNAAYVINSLQSAIAGAERVFTLLDEEEEVADQTSLTSHEISAGHVSFEHVAFGYTQDNMLMGDVSFEVKPNEMVAIVGPTGGGKTTLLNLLMRFYEINNGTIRIDGTDIASFSRSKLRQKIGMVLQDTWLFHGTIADNIAYGKIDATREEIVHVAKEAHCDHFITTLPHGYDTMISSDSTTLSQGEMQLLTIARAMLANPSIMILDEATSSVDTRTEMQIQKAMSKMMIGKTSFVIAHRLSTIVNADVILVVKDGDIIERGNHQSLLAKDGFYASLYRSQFA